MHENAIKTHLSFEKTCDYILSISNIPRDDLPVRVMQNWHTVSTISNLVKIHGYLVPWVLETWGAYCDRDMRDHLIETIFSYKLRNRNILKQIYCLSAIFESNEVPVLFLKGAAGLVQNLYPSESRFLADIDILVKDGHMDRAEALLIADGYVLDNSVVVPSYHHHIALYRHSQHPGTVELHNEPYDFSMLHRPAMPGIWGRAQHLERDGVEITVPSLDDHFWITLRSHGHGKVTVTRFHEAIELFVILQAGHAVDFELLRRRCARDMIPRLLDGVLYTLHHYLDKEPPEPYHVSDAWIRWSDDMNRRHLGEGVKKSAPEQRFGCLHFLNDGKLGKKILLFNRKVRYEASEDMELCHLPAPHTNVIIAYRYLRNILLLIVLHIQYRWREPSLPILVKPKRVPDDNEYSAGR